MPRMRPPAWCARSLVSIALCAAVAGGVGPSATAEPGSLLSPLRRHMKLKALRPFRPELEALAGSLVREGRAEQVAVYFRSLNDGLWMGIDERVPFAPASLVKVPIMLIYYKMAEKDPSVLERELEVTDVGNYAQYVPSRVKLKKGERLSVERLIEVMIEDSNNDAMLTLSKHFDPEVAERTYRRLGYAKTFEERGDFLQLKTYVGTFRVLYNGTFLNEELSEKALRHLARGGLGEGIRAGVPEDVTVAGKFGEYVDPARPERKQLHDVGIVYHPDNPYLLGVMTRGRDHAELSAVIREISSFIYREVDRQYRAPADGFDFDFENED